MNVLENKITLESSGFEQKLGRAREGVAKAVESFKGAALALTGLGTAFAGFRGIETFTENLRGAIEQGRQLVIQSRQTGESIQTLIQLKAAFREAGIAVEGVSGALFFLNKSLGGINEEGQPTSTAFSRIGLSIAELKKQNAVEQFKQIIDGLQQLPDQASRANVAMQIFGRGARDILAVLSDPKGFEEATANSAEFAASMARNAAALERVDKLTESLQGQFRKFYAELAGELAPALEQVLSFSKQIKLGDIGANLGRSLAVVVEAFSDGKVFALIGAGLTAAFTQAVDVLYRGIYGLAGAIQGLFVDLPRYFESAFKTITDPSYWKGIAKLALGAFLSIEGALVGIFARVVDKFRDGVLPILRAVAPVLGLATDIFGTKKIFDVGASAEQAGNKDTTEGVSLISGAAGSTASSALQLISNFKDNFLGAYSANGSGLTGPALDALSRLTSELYSKLKPASEEEAPQKKQQDTGKALDNFQVKDVDADSRARIGLFVGSSSAAPGLSEARRTAAATEAMRDLLKNALSRPAIVDLPTGVYA